MMALFVPVPMLVRCSLPALLRRRRLDSMSRVRCNFPREREHVLRRGDELQIPKVTHDHIEKRQVAGHRGCERVLEDVDEEIDHPHQREKERQPQRHCGRDLKALNGEDNLPRRFGYRLGTLLDLCVYLWAADMQGAAVLLLLLLLLLVLLKVWPVPGVTEDPVYGDDGRVVREVEE